jgi:hypothetical protein
MLQSGGITLYSDHFSVSQVITQTTYWDFEVTQSNPPRAHGTLTVTINPNNKTWSTYQVFLPYAANITAYEYPSHHALGLVASNKTGRVLVNLGSPRSRGYTFVLSFDVASGLWELSGGVFVFEWSESGWGTFGDGYHSIPGAVNVSLPSNATFLDVVGVNSIALNPNVTENGSKSVVGIPATLPEGQSLGWIMVYNDSSHGNSQSTSASSNTAPAAGVLNTVLAEPISFLPLTLGSFSLWTAVMSIFLLVGSELLAPAYGKTGILINRRRLRIAALALAAAFVAVTAYAIILQQSIQAAVGH